ncbi:hypothetical protein MKW92_008133 [Papaver armeniacum]|nr:hypothetical protein MKW92_008133 [Papaver armeniacum]
MFIRKPPLPRLLLNNVSCMRNAQLILRNINASVHDGGALVLTGTNGAGKSTFLRMLACFSRPSAGEILWNGHDITNSGVFEQYKLQLNWLSLRDAVKEKFTVLDNYGKSKAALELTGLGRLINEKARMLLWYIIAEHRKKGRIVFVATHLPIQIEDAMILRLQRGFEKENHG